MYLSCFTKNKWYHLDLLISISCWTHFSPTTPVSLTRLLPIQDWTQHTGEALDGLDLEMCSVAESRLNVTAYICSHRVIRASAIKTTLHEIIARPWFLMDTLTIDSFVTESSTRIAIESRLNGPIDCFLLLYMHSTIQLLLCARTSTAIVLAGGEEKRIIRASLHQFQFFNQ